MKKIININLSGRVIPIEDSAYEKLQAYIESLRRYFANEEGRDEIINDIESRIAELMNDKVRKGAAAVTDADVEEIIASMGRPQDFDADNENAGSSQQGFSSQQGEQAGGQQAEGETFTRSRPRTRLYRNTSDKFVGGVCSGIAAYLNVDPAIVRILFAIITFGGFGLGFLIYILLWMILPTSDLDGYRGKRLYRNPDDKVIGGVAGGLAAYFNKETWIIRLIFAGPLALSILLGVINGAFFWGNHFDLFPNLVFGSLNGTLCLIYIVLWIVLPEARTNYEKMEMRGETVDVNSIRQNVREQMGNINERMKSWGEEVKTTAQDWSKKATDYANTRGKTFASEVGQTAGRTGSGIGHAIGVLFRVFFMFIFGTIAFALFVAVVMIIFGAGWLPVNNFIWTSNTQQFYAWATLIFFLAVPLIGIITWMVRRLLKVRSRSSYLGWTFGFLWTLGWIALVLFGSSISRDFRITQSVESDLAITQPTTGLLTLKVTDPVLYNNHNIFWWNEAEGFSVTEDTAKLSYVQLRFERSADSEYHVSVLKNASGSTRAEATARAEKIQYRINSDGNTLDLGNFYTVDRESKFRFQHVEVVIEVPAGKKIRFDESVFDRISGVDFERDWYRTRNGRRRNYERHYSWRSGVDYIMKDNGDLVDANGRTIEGEPETRPGSRYRYEDNKTLEERERIWKEEGERIEKEKKNKKDSTKPAQIGQNNDDPPADGGEESIDDNESSSFSVGFLSPIDAVVKFY